MRWRKKTVESRLDKELRYHFERMVRDFIAEGIDPTEARRRARLEFGGIDQIKEECRDVRGHWLQDFVQDLRYAARNFARSPGFLAISVLTLALGIGGNTAIFSLIDALMLRSLPVQQPGRLVQIARLQPNSGLLPVSYPLFQALRRLRTLPVSAIELASNPVISIDGVEEQVNGELVSGDHFALLGLRPLIGRLLEPADDAVTPAIPAAVISYRYWQRRFGLNSAVIGRTFIYRKQVLTIVGVTPAEYEGTRLGRDPDITMPLTMMLSENQRSEPTNNMFSMLARLAPGATTAQAGAELQVHWKGYLEGLASTVRAKDRPEFLRQRITILDGSGGFSPLRNYYADALLILMGIVGLVLLLACANLAGLLLARAASRQREISIRLAIGARSGRLLRQFLTESLLLSAIGGCGGLLLAYWFSTTIVNMMSGGGTMILNTAPDWRVLLFTAAISLFACLASGLAPGFHAFRTDLNPGLRQVRTGTPHRLGRSLVITQLSLSMVLLVGATLFVGTLVKLYRVDLGLRTDGVLLFFLRQTNEYPEARAAAVQTELLARLSSMPGVVSTSAVDVLPISGSIWDRRVQVEGYSYRPNENETAGFNAIAPNYFATIGTPFVSGRDFDSRDTGSSKTVAIVNESFARYFFGDKSPLGRQVTSLKVTYDIVGVVKDAKYQSIRQEAIKTMYIPWLQSHGEQPHNFNYLVRVASGDPMSRAAEIERLVPTVDPAIHVRMARGYSDIVNGSISMERLMATLGGFFGLLALIVAGLGIFGVLSFQVSRRVNEIGVRLALGSGRRAIISLILREVAVMVVVGCVIGAVAALALTGLARKLLFGVTPADPVAFALSAIVLGAAALTAGWLPAYRASRIDPMSALRHD